MKHLDYSTGLTLFPVAYKCEEQFIFLVGKTAGGTVNSAACHVCQFLSSSSDLPASCLDLFINYG